MIYYRRLPHWDQPGSMCFVTWRTIDSIPAEVLHRWRVERAIWLRQYKIDPHAKNWREQLNMLPIAALRNYHTRFTSPWMECLDKCHGACVLRQPALSAIVAESLRFHDGAEYELSDFVVMPNHVHILAQFRARAACELAARIGSIPRRVGSTTRSAHPDNSGSPKVLTTSCAAQSSLNIYGATLSRTQSSRDCPRPSSSIIESSPARPLAGQKRERCFRPAGVTRQSAYFQHWPAKGLAGLPSFYFCASVPSGPSAVPSLPASSLRGSV